MPSIVLKYKSPEFADPHEEPQTQKCDMQGCPNNGEHKAPKHRGLDDYYHFCTTHIKEYNKAWDFFHGMSEREVQKHMRSSQYGDRPTWKQSDKEDLEETLYKTAQNFYYDGNESHTAQNEENTHHKFVASTNSPEHKAMAVMGISPPLTMEELKTRYKTLAKKYHPDLNKNDPDAEELLKKINMSYTILKLAFAEYEKLPDRQA